jgi:hypothetical protein
MGQFHTFAARSDFVKKYMPDAELLVPTMERLRIFRDKHGAHRSIDAPRKGDTEEIAIAHAMSLGALGGLIRVPRPGSWPRPSVDNLTLAEEHQAMRLYMHRSSYLGFQIHDAKQGTNVEFVLERDHPTIAQEAYRLIGAVVAAH